MTTQPIEIVDVLCVGSGVASLAVATAAADAGLSVRVADCNPSRVAFVGNTNGESTSWATALQHRWGGEELTLSTRWYLDALTRQLGHPGRLASAPPPLSVVDGPHAAGQRCAGENAVAPFLGCELKDWARECLASPYGFICSEVCRPGMTTLRLGERGLVEAAAIGSAPVGELTGMVLADWLSSRVRDRGIQVDEGCGLKRLLFTNGHMSGAVIDGPRGTRAVRSRHGMVLATGGGCIGTALPETELPPHTVLHVCLVTKIAGRFGRVELLAENSGGQLVRPTKDRNVVWSRRTDQLSNVRTKRHDERQVLAETPEAEQLSVSAAIAECPPGAA